MFDFFQDGKDLSAYFENPKDFISTTDPKDVPNCLMKIDEAIENGYYVAGFVTYEAAGYLYPTVPFNKMENLPLLWFGLFKEKLNKPLIDSSDSFTVSKWKPNMTKQEYGEAFSAIQQKINDRLTEQVNYTIQMEASFTGDDFAYYKQLASAQESNFSAYLSIDQFSILCASPELFFHIKDGEITTRPMKGTSSRGYTYEEDVKKAHWLRHSEKNQKENLVSVELMKRELEKISEPNSIEVPEKFTIEQYPTVFQMTSTVKATLKENISTKDLFETLFPSSSITGHPKRETMELIATYEKAPRQIYCGALGYFTPEKEGIFNVPIRTVLINKEKEKAIYGVGGAIMAASTRDEEYNEILTKAKILTEKRKEFALLETIGLIDGEYFVLENHLNRLKHSAKYFNFPFPRADIENKLQQITRSHPIGSWIIRVLVSKTGELKVEVLKMNNIENNRVTLAERPIKINNPFLYHKTTERSMYEEHSQDQVFDVLLWNEKGEITEFTKGNVVIKRNGKLITPPVTCGLLPGTFREKLIKEGILEEAVIKKDDLKDSEKIFFINSVRQWIKVELG